MRKLHTLPGFIVMCNIVKERFTLMDQNLSDESLCDKYGSERKPLTAKALRLAIKHTLQ